MIYGELMTASDPDDQAGTYRKAKLTFESAKVIVGAVAVRRPLGNSTPMGFPVSTAVFLVKAASGDVLKGRMKTVDHPKGRFMDSNDDLNSDPNDFGLQITEENLREYAQSQGIVLEELLLDAGRHFLSEKLGPRHTLLTDVDLESLIDDDMRVFDDEVPRVE